MVFRSFLTGLLLILFFDSFLIASESNEKQIETKRSGYWTYYCKNNETERQCEIVRKINIEEHNDTFLIIYRITKDINSKIKENFNITTPPDTKVNIKKRLKISFDDKTRFTKSFLKCEETSCLAVFKSNKMLKYSMKNFNEIKIIFYGFEDEEPISLTLLMDGFTQALDNINQQLKSF